MQPPQSLHLGLPSPSSLCPPITLSGCCCSPHHSCHLWPQFFVCRAVFPAEPWARLGSYVLRIFCSIFLVSLPHSFQGSAALPGDCPTHCHPLFGLWKSTLSNLVQDHLVEPCWRYTAQLHDAIHADHDKEDIPVCHGDQACARGLLKAFHDSGYWDFWRPHPT